MQLDKLYQTGSTGEIETTADLSSIGDDNFLSDFTDPYLMGYIPRDMMPACLSPIKPATAEGTLTLQPDPDVNIGWGYCQRNFQAYAGEIAVTDGSTLSRYCPVSSQQTFFINNIEMSRVVNQGQITVTYYAEFIKNDVYDNGIGTAGFVRGGTDAGSVLTSRFFTETYNITDFIDICKNGGTLINRTLTNINSYSPIYGIQFPVRLSADDFPKPINSDDVRGVFLDFTAEADCHVFVAIAGYRFAFPQYVHSDDTTSNLFLVPFSAFSDGSKKYMYVPPVEPTNQALRFKYDINTGLFSDFSPVGDGTRPAFAYDNIDGYLLGGFNMGTLDRSDGLDDIVYPQHGYAIRRNFYVEWENASGSVVTLRLQSIYSLDDVYNFVALWHKHAKTAADVSSTYNNNIYTTIFTADDAYTGDYMSGDLTVVSDRLRPWQFPSVPITANDFTPDDIPDPESGEDEESGDKIDFIMRSFSGASNFITNYVMTRHQVGIFGNRLWTSWVDSLGNPTEMIKNIRIFYTGGDTGSIDIGSVMPFIVSMKIFPFDLSNFIGYETDGIKIGTGRYPISVPGCWYLPRSSVYVSCGTVTIPRIFNDFRDYENMNIMCYVPYCGTVELNPGDVIGRTLSCTYGVDLQSGGCTAYIIVDNNYPVATISGQMGSSVPLTATNSGQLMSQRLSDISGASALIGSTTMQVQRESEQQHPKQSNMDSAIVGAVLQAADSVPQRFRRSAISCPTMSAGNGLDAFAQPPTPYIQMRYGIYDLPANYKHSIGRISTKSNRLSEYKNTGFITCSNVDTSPLTCHNDEKAAIKAALESGVYI